MSSEDEESHSKERKERKRSNSPRRKDRDNRRRRYRGSDEEDKKPERRRRDSKEDDRDRQKDRYDRSRSPRDRYSHRRGRRDDKPRIPQRPKLFQRAADESTSNVDNNKWSTRIAAVASGDGERSKFEKLLGMHKKPSTSESNKDKPALKSVDESDVKTMRKELTKMEHDLNSQYDHARAFTHSFRGRGL